MAKGLKARVVLQGDPKQHKSPGGTATCSPSWPTMLACSRRNQQNPAPEGRVCRSRRGVRAGSMSAASIFSACLGRIVYGEGHDKLVERYAGAVAAGRDRNIIILDSDAQGRRGADGEAQGGQESRRAGRGRGTGVTRGGPRLDAGRARRRRAMPGMSGSSSSVRPGSSRPGTRHGGGTAAAPGQVNPEHFGVFKAGEVQFAVGDVIRITNNGRDVTGKHRVDNGRIDTIAGFTKAAASGWRTAGSFAMDFAHWKHGLVSTSPAAQARTTSRPGSKSTAPRSARSGPSRCCLPLARQENRRHLHRPLPRGIDRRHPPRRQPHLGDGTAHAQSPPCPGRRAASSDGRGCRQHGGPPGCGRGAASGGRGCRR